MRCLRSTALFAAAVTALSVLSANTPASQQDPSRLRGEVKIDGSSTVYPITQAVAEEFRDVAPNVRVIVSISGSGGGFKRFASGETDISNASRPIKKNEFEAAKQNNVNFIEVPVAYDGLSIVVNPSNSWVDSLTVDELKKIFVADGAAKTWNEVRADWPKTPIKIFAPGTDSGTFDYFKEVIAGSSGRIRSDMSVSEDDNVLVTGVAGDPTAIGFFGYAYYVENRDKLKIVPIVNPDTNSAVTPTMSTIESGEYAPFSRPLFIYVNADSLRRLDVRTFVDSYLQEVSELAAEVGYVPLPKSIYQRAAANIKARKTGTQFLDEDGKPVTGALSKVYK